MATNDQIFEKLSDLTAQVATLNAHVEWLRNEYAHLCQDVENLKQFKSTVYGVTAVITLILNGVLYFVT